MEELTALIAHGHINKAINALSLHASGYSLLAIRDEIDEQRDTYRNILKHTFSGVNDPERDNVYRRLKVSLFELTDKVREAILSVENQSADQRLIISMNNPAYRDEVLRNAGVLLTASVNRNAPLSSLFTLVRLSNRLTAAEKELLQQIFQSQDTFWYEKCLLVSALQISAFRYFDPEIIILLIQLVQLKQNEVWQRALTALILLIEKYQQRIIFYPEIINRLKLLYDDRFVAENTEVMIIQFLRSKETEKVKQKLQNEIIPEVNKLKPRLQDKLGLENIISEMEGEGKNPDWQVIFNDVPDLYKRIEEISHLHLEGIDVFMSAFSQLKYFGFFSDMINWFVPFYPANPTARDALSSTVPANDIDNFILSMAQSGYMCNSDKYSLCLNIKHLPEVQKSMMINLVKLEMENMKEQLHADSVIAGPAHNKAIFTQYLQDIYRFYYLFSAKEEFDNPFATDFSLFRNPFFTGLVNDEKILRNIAEYFFEKNYFADALDIYLTLTSKNDREILEKSAYCLQRLKRFSEALDYYDKVLLFDQIKPWHYKNMAYCCSRMKEYEKALKYYLEAAKYEPEDLQLQADLGRCYIHLKDYDMALKCYFKIEYLAPSNTRIMRPVAWCSFMLDKTEQASKYYQRLIETGDANAWDRLNAGHLAWCNRMFNDAITHYRECFRLLNNNESQFISGFYADADILVAKGIAANEIPMMIDAVLFMSN